MYYKLDEKGNFLYPLISNEGISDWTKVPMPQPINTPVFIPNERLETGEWTGEWMDDGIKEPTYTQEEKIILEKLWRNSELNKADVKIFKIEDGHIQGDVSAWRSYRNELRNWPQHEKFPNSGFRPVAPSN